jgi:hypothetical protein
MTKQVHCANFQALSVLYATGELEDSTRAAVEAHAHDCAACAAALDRERTLCDALAAHGEAVAELDRSGFLLARCRSELSEALDDLTGDYTRGWRNWWRPANWATGVRRSWEFHSGWSAAALLLAGTLAGLAGPEWYRRASFLPPGQPVMTVVAPPRLSDQVLETMNVEGIRWEKGEGAFPRVELQLRAERPVVLQGSPNDGEIRDVLAFVVANGARFDPGVRLDSLELLRTHASDPRVSGALRRAAQRDPNPAVRLRALESLRDLGTDPDVRQTLLQALAKDENSGVRVEAMNGLLAALGAQETSAQPDADMLEILRDRVRNDPNNYVRLRSATALAQLASARTDRPVERLAGGPRP